MDTNRSRKKRMHTKKRRKLAGSELRAITDDSPHSLKGPDYIFIAGWMPTRSA
jgi:hypothetical protein